jgi:hypothetical protein
VNNEKKLRVKMVSKMPSIKMYWFDNIFEKVHELKYYLKILLFEVIQNNISYEGFNWINIEFFETEKKLLQSFLKIHLLKAYFWQICQSEKTKKYKKKLNY